VLSGTIGQMKFRRQTDGFRRGFLVKSWIYPVYDAQGTQMSRMAPNDRCPVDRLSGCGPNIPTRIHSLVGYSKGCNEVEPSDNQ